MVGPTAVGWKVALGAEQTPLGVPTVRARQTIRVEMLFEPTLYDDVTLFFDEALALID